MKKYVVVLALAVWQGPARAEFRFRDLDAKSLELSENGAPVFVYNHGVMLPEGVPADRARCCYLHPVYAPNGAVVTDDFPKDHPHHRGISWIWPVVKVGGESYDLWDIRGIRARFEQWKRKEAGRDRAVLAFRDGWYVGEKRVAQEEIEIAAHPATNGKRDMDFTVSLLALVPDVSIAGTQDQGKGYGGFTLRFGPRTGTVIDTPEGKDVPDSNLHPLPWAELTGDFGGRHAGARITIDSSNPGAPNGWCLRHYGFLGVNYPGLQTHRLDRNKPLVLKYRVTLLGAR